MNRDDLGRAIVAQRVKKHVSQEKLAYICMMSRTKLSRLENGTSGTLEDYNAVLSALGLGELMPVPAGSGIRLAEYAISELDLLSDSGKQDVVSFLYGTISTEARARVSRSTATAPTIRNLQVEKEQPTMKNQNISTNVASVKLCDGANDCACVRTNGRKISLLGGSGTGKTGYLLHYAMNEAVARGDIILATAVQAMEEQRLRIILENDGYTVHLINDHTVEAPVFSKEGKKAYLFCTHDALGLPLDEDSFLEGPVAHSLCRAFEEYRDADNVTMLFDELPNTGVSHLPEFQRLMLEPSHAVIYCVVQAYEQSCVDCADWKDGQNYVFASDCIVLFPYGTDAKAFGQVCDMLKADYQHTLGSYQRLLPQMMRDKGPMRYYSYLLFADSGNIMPVDNNYLALDAQFDPL